MRDDTILVSVMYVNNESGSIQPIEEVKEIVKHSDVLGVKYLTVYAFSTENWKRPADEVSGIFRLLVLYVAQELKELHQNNVKVQILGDWSALPEDAVKAVRKALDTTKDNTGLVFSIAITWFAFLIALYLFLLALYLGSFAL